MKSTRDLQAVAALARFRNFSRAADAIGLTQPALSRQLKRIEEELGVSLFDRSSGQGVTPTAAGEVAIARAANLLGAYNDLVLDVRKAGCADADRLSIVATMSPTAISVSKAVTEFARLEPNVQVQFTTNDLASAMGMLHTREADIGVLRPVGHRIDDLAVHRLSSRPHRFYCRAGHPLALFPEATARQISAFPLVGCLMERAMLPLDPENLGAAGKMDPITDEFVPKIFVNSFSAAYDTVQSSNAIGWSPLCLLKDSLARGDIAVFDLTAPTFQCSYDALMPAERTPSRVACRFVGLLESIERAIT